MKAYWVANYTEIKDDERLKKYAIKAKEAVEKYSGKIIARSANNVTLEGREMVRIDSDVDVNITNLDTISGGLELELDFDSQLSPADVLLSEIVKLFPDVEINGEYKFYDEDESYSWKGELGL